VKLKKHTIKMLREIKRRILAEPRQFDLHSWFFHDPEAIPNCGTSACIAGWAITIAHNTNPEKASELIDAKGGPKDPFLEGEQALGITDIQGYRLFLHENWPAPFDDQYQRYVRPLNKAKVACARIDHFIKTNGQE